MALKYMHYSSEQKYGFITSLMIHSLVFVIFFTFSVYKKDDNLKTYYIEFAQFNEQIPVQTTKSLKPSIQNFPNEPENNEKINEPPKIEQPLIKEPEPVKHEVKPEPIPEPVKEVEKPKIIEPEETRLFDEKPVIKETTAKVDEAVIRNPSFENQNAVKVASKPAPIPQPQVQSNQVTSTHAVIQTQSVKKDVATLSTSLSSPSHSAGKTSLIETEFGRSGAPVFVHRQMPVYPMMARKLGKEGKVVLKLHINEKGKLLNIEVVESAGYGFTESAIEAVKMSTFAPAYEKGTGIESKALLTIRFVIKKS
ncbi:MAG: energy transducer TonB [Nitrospirae bacterium]|jgi:protein TonB|nr:energy transducer TonB [Nitrospirota bacterium]